MTSDVTALSGIVANGHQAIHFVSSAPSKIPYGGFSPVRLQTRLTPRPPSPALPRWFIGRHCRYLRPRRWIRSRTCVQAAPKTSDHDRGSSGPWLPNRLYCPAGSLLTMATSAPLTTDPPAYGLFRGTAGPTRQPQRVPNLLCQSVHPMPSPVLRWLPRLPSTMPSSRVLPSPNIHWLGSHKPHPFGIGGLCNEAAAFA
jgi:hypothetical protein